MVINKKNGKMYAETNRVEKLRFLSADVSPLVGNQRLKITHCLDALYRTILILLHCRYPLHY